MADTKDMTRIESSPRVFVYHNKVTVGDAETSDVYLVPAEDIRSISLQITGDGVIELTNDTQAAIEGDTAVYVEWDGASQITNAITGWRVKSNSGSVTARVTMRARND